MGQIRDLQHAMYGNAVAHGFHDKPRTPGEGLMLIVTELAEAMEDVREGRMWTHVDENGKPYGFPSEIADAVIRCMDLAGQLGFDLEDEILLKHKYNRDRPFRHGGKTL